MRTRRGIYNELKISPYKATIEGITFYFSSRLHLNNFLKRLDENRQRINTSLSNRFNVDVQLDQLADVVLYVKIESRGFLITTKEGEHIKWLDNLQLDGDRVIIKTLNAEYETLTGR